MSVNKLEASLRNALAKGDIHDAAFRRRVYEAAAAAMKRSLEARGTPTAEAVGQQTERLTEAIEAIEHQLRLTVPTERDAPVADNRPPAVAPDPLDPVPPIADAPTPTVGSAPSVDAATERRGSVEMPTMDRTIAASAGPSEPRLFAPEAEPAPMAPEVDGPGQQMAGGLHAEPRVQDPQPMQENKAGQKPRRLRGPFATAFSVITLIALLFAGLWWVLTSGAFVSEEARDTSVPNPPATLENEDFAGRDPGTASAPLRLEDIAAGEDGWVVLFTPTDPTVLRLQGAASASVESDPFGDYARIVTRGEDSIVQIGIPEGVLQRLAGQTVQIGVLARTDEGVQTQMSVTCDLAEMGDCGRRRFNVGQSPTEFLFSIDLPSGVRPSRAGVLNIETDIEAGENAVLLLAVRMRGPDG